jgi:hypothetical protein
MEGYFYFKLKPFLMSTIDQLVPLRRRKPQPPFPTEAAMTAAAIARMPAFWRSVLPCDFAALEAVGPGAVADVVLASFDAGAITARETNGITPIVDWTTLGCVLACRQATCTNRELAAALTVSDSTARRATALAVAAGALVRDGNAFVTHPDWRPAARRLVALELKLRDWPHGLAQAVRYRDWADTSWLVLGATDGPNALEDARAAGIGLARLGTDGSARVFLKPRRQSGFDGRVRAWIGEQALLQAEAATASAVRAPAATSRAVLVAAGA